MIQAVFNIVMGLVVMSIDGHQGAAQQFTARQHSVTNT